MTQRDVKLSEEQRKALSELGPEPGHYRVNWRPNLSREEFLELRKNGLIEEHWTWASRSRPDVGISQAGRALLNGGKR